ncbi:MAG: flagellar hook-associated protein FlgL [Pseudomonadota bacterium]
MRLSTAQLFQQGINSIVQEQARFAELDLRIASGKRILTPSDDPAGAVQVNQLTADIAHFEQVERNISVAEGTLASEEGVLNQVGDSLQRVRELLVQSANDTLDDNNRRAIAIELTGLREHLMSLANTRDASGQYLFSGFQTETQPFAISSGQVVYNGDQGHRQMDVGQGVRLAIADSGFHVFESARTGNGTFSVNAEASNTGSAVVTSSADGQFVPDTYTVSFSQPFPTSPMTYLVTDGSGATVSSGNWTEGDQLQFQGVQLSFSGIPDDGDSFTVEPSARQSMFATLTDAIDVLNGDLAGGNATSLRHNRLNSALENVDQAMVHTLEIRSAIGSRLNNLSALQSLHDDQMLTLQTTLSATEDLNLVEAINEVNAQRVALQAAQSAYLQIRDLSLFNYL